MLAKPKAAQVAGESADAAAEVSMEGMQVMRKTDTVEDDMFDSVKKGQKGKKSKKGRQATGEEAAADKKLTHSMDVLSLFS